ncbi:alpha/beta fold hydrolase [Microbaculum sp. FT89]|uniref:alpha/beta fold hydrolase n=1 Tax=Microbaculum sp. FT89 TaxID=3447298 RepID=UPI003F52D672
MSGAMHVIEAGEGRPLLCLHGWSCHGGFFGPQVEAFRSEARVVTPDLPGHGRTGRDGPALTIEAAADAVAGYMAERGFENVIVVGWSMGAHVAYAMIERHGTSRLAGLVSIDMTPKVLNDDAWHLGLSDGLDAARNVGVRKSIQTHWPEIAPRIAKRIFARGLLADRDLLAFAEQQITAADPAMLAPMWASLTAQDFRDTIGRIDIPVLLAHGARSALYGPAMARWQRDRLRNGRLVTFPRSGHAPHLEEPAAFKALLSDFIA